MGPAVDVRWNTSNSTSSQRHQLFFPQETCAQHQHHQRQGEKSCWLTTQMQCISISAVAHVITVRLPATSPPLANQSSSVPRPDHSFLHHESSSGSISLPRHVLRRAQWSGSGISEEQIFLPSFSSSFSRQSRSSRGLGAGLEGSLG
jgi:hypothetical protein